MCRVQGEGEVDMAHQAVEVAIKQEAEVALSVRVPACGETW